jgi:redox-sensitive bicupin YhaK (pirin superfamily)
MALHLARNIVSRADQELFIRRSEERGFSNQGWIQSFYTFSFGDYYDLRFMGFRMLKVLNENRVAAGEGFPPHPDKNIELLTYVISGGLAHKDNMVGEGVVSLLRPGELQRVTAGEGVRHSEFNASEHDGVHFLEISIEPAELNLTPSSEQKYFSPAERLGALKLIASKDGRDGSVLIHQDAFLYSGLVQSDSSITSQLSADRYGWLQVVKGSLVFNGVELKQGDGVAIFGGGPVHIGSPDADESISEFLLFDLA